MKVSIDFKKEQYIILLSSFRIYDVILTVIVTCCDGLTLYYVSLDNRRKA